MKKEFLTNLLKNNKFNPTKRICNHLVGENHTLGHRMWVGTVFIITGVSITKVGDGIVVHFVCDCVGWLIHGAGAIPFIEKLEKWRRENPYQDSDQNQK